MQDSYCKVPDRLLLKLLFDDPRARYLGLKEAARECGITSDELVKLSESNDGPEFIQLGDWYPKFLYLGDSVRNWCCQREKHLSSS